VFVTVTGRRWIGRPSIGDHPAARFYVGRQESGEAPRRRIRDAIGLYRVGVGAGGILLDFSMEAKCYAPGNSVGVRELSRLISRLRHRQFGVLVTTSHLDLQAYKS
jgi:hypothetical protein